MTRRDSIRRRLDRGYPGIDQVISDLEWAMAQIERAEAVLRRLDENRSVYPSGHVAIQEYFENAKKG